MAKIRSFGTAVYIDGVSVGGLTDASLGGVDVSNIDMTTHDSSGGFKEFVGGLIDGGTLELTGKFDIEDAGQEDLRDAEGSSAEFCLLFSDNSGFAFTAIGGGFSTSNPLDDALEFTCSAKVTGESSTVYPTMTVTGTLNDGVNPVTFPVLTLYGVLNGRPAYDNANTEESLQFVDGVWVLDDNGVGEWRSADDPQPMTPDRVTIWTPSGSCTGTPTVTGS